MKTILSISTIFFMVIFVACGDDESTAPSGGEHYCSLNGQTYPDESSYKSFCVESISSSSSENNTMNIDGYPAVKIGNQIWMKKNLNIETDGSMCYNKDSSKCDEYGRLYLDWAARKVCPAGWHLPSRSEFIELLKYVGINFTDEYVPSLNRQYVHCSWPDEGNDYGFSALMGGYYVESKSYRETTEFYNLGFATTFWSSEQHYVKVDESVGTDCYYNENLSIRDGVAEIEDRVSHGMANSVRCIKD